MGDDLPLAGETKKTFAALAREVPGRGRPAANPSTLFRWHRRGVRTKTGRIFLEVVKIGGIFYSSSEALTRFMRAINAEPMPASPVVVKPAKQIKHDRHSAAKANAAFYRRAAVV